MSSEDLRAAPLSFKVIRDEVGLEDEFELFMQWFGTYFYWLRCSRWTVPPHLTSIGCQHRRFFPAAVDRQNVASTTEVIVLNLTYRIQKMRRPIA